MNTRNKSYACILYKEFILHYMSWFNPMGQLSTTQLLAHCPPPMYGVENLGQKLRRMGSDQNTLKIKTK